MGRSRPPVGERAPTLRFATPADSDALAALHVESWRATYAAELPAGYLAGLDPRQRALGWRHWFAETPMRVIVAEARGELVGFCAFGPTRDGDQDPAVVGMIYNLHVAPDRWGGGLGRRLFAATLEALRGTAFRELSLWVVPTNERARRFYERLGFGPDGVRQAEWLAPEVTLPEVRYRAPLARLNARRAAPGPES